MKSLKKIIAVVLSVLVVCLGFAACSNSGKADKTDSEKIAEKGELVVGITDFAPMDYKDENGNWIGFDADLATKTAEKLGVKVKFVEIDWDNKFLELETGSIDCIWNGMTIDEERLQNMSITIPYMENKQVKVVKEK